MERLWTPRETAEFLQQSEQTLANHRWRGVGCPYVKIANGSVRYDPAIVQAWAASQTQTSTSEGRPAAGHNARPAV